MMALVFAPVVGLHFAASLTGSNAAARAGEEQSSITAVQPHQFMRPPG